MTNVYSQWISSTLICLSVLIFSTQIKAQNNCVVANGIITVTNTFDTGIGSLRRAIECANALPGPNEIRFNIPGFGSHIIYVGSQTGNPLPTITDANTIIDGSTQFGFSGDPVIILDGSQNVWTEPHNAIYLRANFCEIYALTIRNFPDDGIDIYQVDNCKVGAPGKGNVIYNNGLPQDDFPGFGSGWEGCGIVVRNGADNNFIQGNIIGTNYDQTIDGGNEWCGIIVRNFSLNNKIGGIAPGEGNVFAYNAEAIRLDNSYNCPIRQNEIYCNDSIAILLLNNANLGKTPPVITFSQTDLIVGTAAAGDVVEVFVNEDDNCLGTPCQGKIFLGSATAFGGNWVLTPPFANNFELQQGMKITVTGTAPDESTSYFSDCRTVTELNFCAEPDGTIWVTNTDDEGLGSLRSAIDCANLIDGPNTIKFDLGDSLAHRFYVGEMTGQALPTLIDESTIIDGTTQPGFGENNDFSPKIILDGSQNDWTQPINAVWIQGDSCEIYGLEIVNFPDDAIDITSADFVKIGAPEKGNVIYNNGYDLDYFPNAPNSGPWDGCGIVIRNSSNFCWIQGNIIGTNYTQDSTGGNEFCGIIIQNNGNNNWIGGGIPGSKNVIAHHPTGILVTSGSESNRIQQNSMYCNEEPIELQGNGNSFLNPPILDTAAVDTIFGYGNFLELIEVFVHDTTGCADAICQGKILLGTTSVDSNNTWSLVAPFANNFMLLGDEIIVATATDTFRNTSPFSNCKTIAIDCNTLFTTFENVQHSTCNEDNGSFEVEPIGGLAPFLFDYGMGDTPDSVLTDLAAGWYYVTITDERDCQVVDSIEIVEVDTPVLSVVTVVNENCSMQNGSITLSASGGFVPYTFDIGNGAQPDSVFENLTAGVYNIILTDSLECTDSVMVTLSNTPAPIAAISSLSHENCEMSDGAFTVFPIGGTAPYTFDIGNGTVSDPNFTGLSSGIYTVTLTDNAGCEATVSTVILDNPPPVGDIVNVLPENCGQADGSFEVTATGGIPPYTFDIGNGGTSDPVFSNLTAGNYLVTLTDVVGCTAAITAVVPGTQALVFSIENILNENCGQSDGGFSVSISSGNPPYTFDIGNGPTTDSLFENLSGGIYNITITDAGGCTGEEQIDIQEITIDLSINQIMEELCEGANGSILVSTTGGTMPFTFDLGNGSQTDSLFSNLSAGVYNITVTDSNSCQDVVVATVGGVASPIAAISGLTHENCEMSDGAFTVFPIGGTAPFLYDIGNGNVSDPNFTNLSSGVYNVTLTDNVGCTDVVTTIVLDVPPPVANILNVQSENCGQADGSFQVAVSGGAPPYMYDIGSGATFNSLFENLSSGNYNVTVTDFFGCTAEVIAVVGENLPAEFTFENIQEENCGQSDGGFLVSVTSGNPPFIFDVGNGATTDSLFENLPAGIYNVMVTDVNDCTTENQITLNEILITLNVDEINNETCDLNNGSFTVSTIGGTAPFTFDIGDGATSNNVFTNLDDEEYFVTVTDVNGCTAEQTVEIIDTGVPTISISNIFDENCGQSDGSFTVSATGGIAPYLFDIGNGTTSDSLFENLSSGIYNIIVTDSTGCTDSIEVTINEISITLNVDEINNETCDLNNGSFTVSTIGGTAPFTFDIGDGATSNNVFTNLDDEEYFVTVTDANGCTAEQTVEIIDTGAPAVAFSNITPESCGQNNGAFTVVVNGGTMPYTFDIGNGATSNNVFTNLNEGNYFVTITDSTGCSAIDSLVVPESSEVNLIVGDVVSASCGQSNGIIVVVAGEGVSPYTFDIGDGATPNNVFTNLSPGTYTVTVTDNGGCTNEVEATVFDNGNFPTAFFTFSNNLLTVNFNSASAYASNFSWDFGDGNTSFEISPTHTYIIAGEYTACLTVTNYCGTDTFCETIVVDDPYDVTFDVEEMYGAPGDTILLPVTVQNFNDIVSFQKSIHLIDTSVAKIIGVGNFNLPGLDPSNFFVLQNEVVVSWLDGFTGQTVPDSTAIYALEIKLLDKIACTDISLDGNPTPVEVVKNINGNNYPVGYILWDGEVCVSNTPLSTYNIAGLIHKENGQTIKDVEVSCTNANMIFTGVNGIYEFFGLPAGGTYTVAPFKNTNVVNGVTIFDMALIQKHILNVQILDSPYKIIAADANHSGTVTTLDMAAIQAVILGNAQSFPNNTSWRFVPEDFVFTDPGNPFLDDFPEEIILPNLNADALDEDFIAIKIGDVNLSAIPSFVPNPNEQLTFIVDNQVVTDEDELVLDFKAKDYSNITAWQMDLEFDAQTLEFEKVIPGALPHFNDANTGHTFLEEGILPLLWVNKSRYEEELQLANETILFSLKFKILDQKKLSKNLIQLNENRMQKMVFQKQKRLDVILWLEELNFENVVFEKDFEEFWISNNYPNPFSENTFIEFFLPKKENVVLKIFDAKGRFLQKIELQNLEKGKHEIEISKSILEHPGVYYYNFQTSEQHRTGKMIFTK